MARLLTYLLLATLCFGIHTYAKEHSADYPALTRFAEKTISQARHTLRAALKGCLRRLDGFAAESEAPVPPRQRPAPLAESSPPAPQKQRGPDYDKLIRDVMDAHNRIEALLEK